MSNEDLTSSTSWRTTPIWWRCAVKNDTFPPMTNAELCEAVAHDRIPMPGSWLNDDGSVRPQCRELVAEVWRIRFRSAKPSTATGAVPLKPSPAARLG